MRVAFNGGASRFLVVGLLCSRGHLLHAREALDGARSRSEKPVWDWRWARV